MARSVLIVGAGMAGLTAGRALESNGWQVKIVDKGRAVGGRMATRRIGDAVLDHGAQHISVRTDAFAREIHQLVDYGTARIWLRTHSSTHPDLGVESRYAGVGGMRRIPEALAAALDIQTGIAITRLDVVDGVVTAYSADAAIAQGDAAILTPPIPQTLDLLDASGLSADPCLNQLASIEYDATLAVMAILDEPSNLDDGHLALSDGPVAWMADNQHKGVSAIPAITIHSSPQFAADRLDDEPGDWMKELVETARPHHRGRVVEAVPHRWRYSQPRTTRNDGALLVEAEAPLVLAGEVFSGARVEGAFTSGRAAADLILNR